MASPDVFRSPRRERLTTTVVVDDGSSSPLMPPLEDVISQRYRKPTLASGSKAAPIPQNVVPGFQSANTLHRAMLGQQSPLTKSREAGLQPESVEELDVSISDHVPRRLSDSTPASTAKKSRPRKAAKPPAPKTRPSADRALDQSRSPKGSQGEAWRKYKVVPSPKSPIAARSLAEEVVIQDEDGEVGPRDEGTKKPRKKLQKSSTTSSHFRKPAIVSPKRSTSPVGEEEGLQLERATARRLDWTPPASKTTIVLDSTSPISQIHPSAQNDQGEGEGDGFKSLVDSFKCVDTTQPKDTREVVVLTDEDSSFLRKRKLIETVKLGQGESTSEVFNAQSPSKKVVQKKQKKKARTITELATRAYQPHDETQKTPTPPSALDVFLEDANMGESATNDVDDKGKGKGKGKIKGGKRVAKPPRKKIQPPKPILLSPTTARRQFAEQDILFGTSSQLAHENSPTFLRDLQVAMKQSNNPLGSESLPISFNSDEMEPLEPKGKLWDAAARDVDGRLFDVEVVNLVDSPHNIGDSAKGSNPFGYIHGQGENEDQHRLDNPQRVIDDSFVDVSEIVRQPAVDGSEHLRDDDSQFSGSDISASTTIGRLQPHPPDPRQGTPGSDKGQSSKFTGDLNQSGLSGDSDGPPRPNFEAYTDVRLSNELRGYGFKPVKQRKTMISLLEQCWRSKHGQVAGTSKESVAAFTTTSAAQASPRSKPKAVKATSTVSVKKPRGRPRKQSSPDAPEFQEPPPSAQPHASPKRPRGRPRKNSIEATKAKSLTDAKVASAISPTRSKPVRAPAASKRKKAVVEQAIEIPDSESDADGFSTPSRSASPDQTFSSPEPADMSVSMAEESQLSLNLSPDEAEKALFACITDAVKSSPRSKDPLNPSWHEKMLMYDPIIIEHLTAWLNAGELTKVGYDAEVKPGDVKKWCESKSVCCLWRVNLRGKERTRY